MRRRFPDRAAAGRELAAALVGYRDRTPLIVLGIPRGGVPVAAEVARELGAPLDVLVVRKLGLPEQPELAMGAVATGGVVYLYEDVLAEARVPAATVEAVVAAERLEVERRDRLFRGDRPPVRVEGATVIVVDDGLATGSTMRAAVLALRQLAPREVVVAVPVTAPRARRLVAAVADDVVAVLTSEQLRSIGEWYDDFTQTSDEEVQRLLVDGWRV